MEGVGFKADEEEKVVWIYRGMSKNPKLLRTSYRYRSLPRLINRKIGIIPPPNPTVLAELLWVGQR